MATTTYDLSGCACCGGRTTVTCDSNPDAPVPESMHILMTICDKTLEVDSDPFSGSTWEYSTPTFIVGDETLGLQVVFIRLFCCGTSGEFSWVCQMALWDSRETVGTNFSTFTASNYTDDVNPCTSTVSPGDEPFGWRLYESQTIDSVDPFQLTVEFASKSNWDFLGYTLSTYWDDITTLAGCGSNDPTESIRWN